MVNRADLSRAKVRVQLHRWFAVCVAALFWAVSLSAQAECYKYKPTGSTNANEVADSIGGVCNAIKLQRFPTPDERVSIPHDPSSANPYGWCDIFNSYACYTNVPQCGYIGSVILERVTVDCGQPVCQAGATATIPVQMGYGRFSARADGALWTTSDGRNFIQPTPTLRTLLNGSGANTLPGGTGGLCDGRCMVVQDGAPPGSSSTDGWWNSKEPNAQGLYSLYRDFNVKQTGAQCSPSDTMAMGAAGSQSCDGFVGQVNGKTVCVAKETPAANQVPNVKVSGTTNGNGRFTPEAGKPTVGPNGEFPGLAGDKPGILDTSGTGSGGTSTPSTSTTVIKDASGTTTGTSTTTYDFQSCGLPGKPACKMDESGTPTAVDLSSATGQLKSAWDTADGMLPSITGTAGKDTSFTMPQWFTAQACQPLNLGTLPAPISRAITIDWCPVLNPALSVISFLWILGMFFVIVNMVGRVTGAGVH